jgi:hypothetical protein
MVDLNAFARNRAQYPPEKLKEYAGRYVAWAIDGREILVDAPDLDTLLDELDRRGITLFVSSFVFDGACSDTGGAGL